MRLPVVFLESRKKISLPEKDYSAQRNLSHKIIPETPEKPSFIPGRALKDIGPLEVRRVQDKAQRDLFKDLLSRYHYLGYAMPFGARLQYLVYGSLPHKKVVGCLQFSSPA